MACLCPESIASSVNELLLPIQNLDVNGLSNWYFNFQWTWISGKILRKDTGKVAKRHQVEIIEVLEKCSSLTKVQSMYALADWRQRTCWNCSLRWRKERIHVFVLTNVFNSSSVCHVRFLFHVHRGYYTVNCVHTKKSLNKRFSTNVLINIHLFTVVEFSSDAYFQN